MESGARNSAEIVGNMLLTDCNPNDTLALQAYETAILDVAAVEGINLGTKLSLATQEISEEVLDILLDHTWSFDSLSTRRRTIGVSDVVVTQQLQRWHALHTLAIVYRDAFNNQLNDRYQVKWREYQTLASNGREHALKFGIGLALNPIPQAAKPVLSTTVGSSAGGTFYVQVRWAIATGQQGAPSPVTALSVLANNLLVVQPVNSPRAATGFNVYAGTSQTALALQNATPVAVGQSFTLPGGGLASGAAPGTGQAPDVYITGGPTLRRG